jgi:hypothetical protein
MSNIPNFRNFCESARIKLLGEPDRRTHKELRWDGGDAYSARTYSVQKRAWYDHGQQRGGSTLDLVAYSKGQPKQKLRGQVCNADRSPGTETMAGGSRASPRPNPTAPACHRSKGHPRARRGGGLFGPDTRRSPSQRPMRHNGESLPPSAPRRRN